MFSTLTDELLDLGSTRLGGQRALLAQTSPGSCTTTRCCDFLVT
jgi:hypothetical protein